MPANERNLYPNIKRVVWSDWAEGMVRQQHWHPMRTAMLYRLGPQIGAKKFATMFGLNPATVSKKAAKLGIQLPKTWRSYEPQELAFIRRNAQLLTYKQMAQHLGRTESSVASIAHAKGIGAGTPQGEHHPCCKATDHEVELARHLYEEGMAQREIAEKMEVNQSTVNRWLNFTFRTNIKLEDYGRSKA